MQSLESIYNSILLENQNPNNIDIELLKECVDGKCTINEDGSIDVDGSVYINNRDLIKIPFKFRNVSVYFTCSNNQLTSLEGAPNTVGGSFNCHNNQLTSLECVPNSVGGNFYCHNILNLPYSELFKIVDKVDGDIFYSSITTPEDKDKIRIDRDVKNVLKDDELGNLDV